MTVLEEILEWSQDRAAWQWHDTVRHATGQIRQVLDTIKADLLAAEAHGDPVVADFLRQTLVQCERPATPVPGIETRTERNDEESTQ